MMTSQSSGDFTDLCLAVFQLKLWKCETIIFRGVSTIDDQNEDETIESSCNPKGKSQKWIR